MEAPNHPYGPASGPPPATVGNGTDWTATVAGAPITTVVGSFDSVSGVSLETGTTYGSGPNCPSPKAGVPNVFSLQLNTKPFPAASLCANSPNPTGATPANGSSTPGACQGWQQFIYSSTYNVVFMQYWLLNYSARLSGNPVCPTSAGWQPSSGGCYLNSPASAVPPQTIANLADMRLTASANSGLTR